MSTARVRQGDWLYNQYWLQFLRPFCHPSTCGKSIPGALFISDSCIKPTGLALQSYSKMRERESFSTTAVTDTIPRIDSTQRYALPQVLTAPYICAIRDISPTENELVVCRSSLRTRRFVYHDAIYTRYICSFLRVRSVHEIIPLLGLSVTENMYSPWVTLCEPLFLEADREAKDAQRIVSRRFNIRDCYRK